MIRRVAFAAALSTGAVLLACSGSSNNNRAKPATSAPPSQSARPAAPATTPGSRPATTGTPARGIASRNAVPIGTNAMTLDGWQLKVNSVQQNATAAVLDRNKFNTPPQSGQQYFIANVTATYTGAGTADFAAGYRLRAIDGSGANYATFDHPCGVVPDDVPQSLVPAGQSVTGNVCWAVPSSVVGALAMFDQPPSISGDPQVFWSLVP